MDSVLDVVRKEAEACDCLQGFQVKHILPVLLNHKGVHGGGGECPRAFTPCLLRSAFRLLFKVFLSTFKGPLEKHNNFGPKGTMVSLI